MEQGHETLGTNVLPFRYAIRLEPDMETFAYKCNEIIDARVKTATGTIALNAKGLKIKKASVASGSMVQVASFRLDDSKERLILRLGRKVKGKISISISCEGRNTDNLFGFYRSKYMHGKREKYILTTQFEAANARNAFPCFDEPAMKARFRLSLIVKKSLDCISNMPVEREHGAGNGKKIVIFKESPVMSTYLLYIGVGNYEYSHGGTARTKIRLVTVPGKGQYAKLPLEYAQKFLAFYERYFGIRFPLPKIDVIAIPDFAAGAMENWGAMTFREVDLLADEDSSVAVKERVAEVIAHELAHQWFGDLVTMKWWNDLWLNESFATFMSYKAMDSVFPEWKMKTQYIDDVIATALAADQLASTHPIRANVRSPAEIDQIFDEISYEKGGSVLNMIEDYVGQETFRKGLHDYLSSHSYSNAANDDLWMAIQKHARKSGQNLDVYRVASDWIEMPGYPIISMARSGGKLELSQKRFILLDRKVPSRPWPIPITYTLEAEKGERRLLMKRQKHAIEIGSSGWIKLNHGQNGIYRVAYPEHMLHRLGDAIIKKKLDGVDAWGTENDLFVFARSGRIKAGSYLDYVGKYCVGSEYPLNENVLYHLGWFYDVLYEAKELVQVKRVMWNCSSALLRDLGWKRRNGESNIDTMLRETAIAKSALSEDPETLNLCWKLFNSLVNNGKDIDQNIRGAVYRIIAWNGTRSEYDFFKGRYMSEQRPDEKLRLLSVLGGFRDMSIARDALKFCMSKDVRYQDSLYVPRSVAATPVARECIWDWTKDHWKELGKRYGSGTHMLGRYVANMGFVSDEKMKREVESFFRSKSNMRADIKQILDKTVERIDVNIKFRDANGL
ncbi:MAG: M1 family metallopeptidase [Candidatus Micrarchaeota archaeon]|nr:M1 family metallopeptidase [Candidatus Micrarchaeota archaeon]